MRVVIAPDKFKGSLTASQAAEAMVRAWPGQSPAASIDQVPMADGGEGTVDGAGGRDRRLATARPGTTARWVSRSSARFGLLGDGRTAAIEMASASGLVLVPAGHRDPLVATTRGTGELLLAAIAAGRARVIVGIGGSATNDGGAGLGQAPRLPPARRRRARAGARRRQVWTVWPGSIRPAAVANSTASRSRSPATSPIRLCGPRGASAVYGPQKGATPAMVDGRSTRNLAHFAAIVERDLGVSIRDLPGSGAAGGLGGGLVAFAGGRLEPGHQPRHRGGQPARPASRAPTSA